MNDHLSEKVKTNFNKRINKDPINEYNILNGA